MTPSSFSTGEQLSALADGELDAADLELALGACAKNPDWLARWHEYHLMGEALRGNSPLPPAEALEFLERLRPGLAPQPPVLVQRRAEAANAPWYSGRWVAGVGVLVVAASLGWTGMSGVRDAQWSLGEQHLLGASTHGWVVRDVALEELMEAHRQQGGASVLPTPSGFLRNATFEVESTTLVTPTQAR